MVGLSACRDAIRAGLTEAFLFSRMGGPLCVGVSVLLPNCRVVTSTLLRQAWRTGLYVREKKWLCISLYITFLLNRSRPPAPQIHIKTSLVRLCKQRMMYVVEINAHVSLYMNTARAIMLHMAICITVPCSAEPSLPWPSSVRHAEAQRSPRTFSS